MINPAQSESHILVVDDELEVLQSFELILNSAQFDNLHLCSDSRNVKEILSNDPGIAVIMLDLIMPHLGGEELLDYLTENHPEIPVIIVTASNELELVVDCMKAGAFDYLVKPVEKLRLISAVRRAMERVELARENQALKKSMLGSDLQHPQAFSAMITRNPAMLAIFKYAEVVAGSSEPVLITGETGVGKELIARAIHDISGLKGPFIAANVAGLDEPAFNDTLFGHKKGAFTGADRSRDGLVKKAAGGTLLLDEIGDLSRESQIKLLRLIQEKEYRPLGSDLPRHSQARILAATNLNLQHNESASNFRRDLYYRLGVHRIDIPPLRKRKEDIPVLVDHFMAQSAGRLGRKTPSYPPELLSLLGAHNFPGNIRELETMIFDAVSRHDTHVLSLEHFKSRISQSSGNQIAASGDALPNPFSAMEVLPNLKEAGRLLVEEAMQRAGGNQSTASRLLGISQPALSRRLKSP